MKKLLLCLFSILGLLITARGQGQPIIKGRVVLAADTAKPLPYVQILNKKRGNGTLSNPDGYYQLKAAPGDSIEFRMIGFENTRIAFSELEKKGFLLPMKERIVTMQAVTIRSPRQSYKQFAPEQKSEDPYVGYRSVKPSGLDPADQKIGLGTTGSGAVLEGAVTEFANLFNKKEKQRKKIRELKAKDREEQYYKALYDYWFDEATVARLTGYKDKDLAEFIAFCKPTLSFLEETTEYQLILTIRQYQQQYELLSDRN
ncbi:carboxypeptidase-like regulatory domain-containing protein [Cesiribacter sp. SM1]|uniref:carboxypeptidase-like regulatory domain-containing protein n=1 Tax=Cesiribacter sp. SM1 TaxID=2861196 RepID=UPI001CD34223|nr:carboxypeptidase-like regulatory domain-containing protein [Cesiribacter sp. SM1]